MQRGRERRACGPVVRQFVRRLSSVLTIRFNFDLQPGELIENVTLFCQQIMTEDYYCILGCDLVQFGR